MAVRVSVLSLVMTYAILLAAPPANSEERRGFRTAMIRRETTTPINFTRAAQQSRARLSMLAAAGGGGGASAQTPLRWDGAGAYNMEVSIGTPPQNLTALADTGSDLVWAKCGPCASCAPQGSPSYDPTMSSTFSTLPCSDRLCQALDASQFLGCGGGGGGGGGGEGGTGECEYRYSYGLAADEHHYTQGYMGSETFTLGSDAVKGVGFGCTTASEGGYGTGSGLVGLGRGPLSLVSQLGVGAFSYCLVQDPSKSSPLLFGAMATLTSSGSGVQSTPLLDSPSSYAVDLQSISIGSTATPGGGTDGVVFDSGTTLTYLADPAYTAAKTAILSQTTLPRADDRYGFEACFQASNGNISDSDAAAIPVMVLRFDGADMELQVANYFIQVENGVICWVVQSSPSSVALIGNIMQMNFHIRHDLDNKVLSFQPADCGSL